MGTNKVKRHVLYNNHIVNDFLGFHEYFYDN